MSLNKQALYRFDPFRLDVRERRLWRSGEAVATTPKVLDALVLLVENAGALVERSTMRERLWPGQIVEDGTLARVIADLRKALGDVSEGRSNDARRYIETVPKYGYRFVASVKEELLTAVNLAEPLDSIADQVGAPHGPVHSVPPAGARWIIALAAGIVLLSGAAFALNRMRHPQRSVQTLLITPFDIVGNAPEAIMIQGGLQDSLTMELSGLSGLAAIEFKTEGTALLEDPAELGRRRKTGFVLAGSIVGASGRLHINARLLRSATGEALWAHSFEEDSGDLLKMESLVAKLTVSELIPVLPNGEDLRMSRRRPSNAVAYRYYLLGRHYWNKRDENAYFQAIDNFKRAAEADPQYAPAYVGLADTYLLQTGSPHRSSQEMLPLAKAAIEKAIQLDSSLGEAHATLALMAGNYDFDWDKEERELRSAIQMAPNYVTAHHWYAEFLTMMGKFSESEAEFEVARNLDPASPIILTDLAQLYNFERNYSRSLQTLDEVLKLDASFHLAHTRKGYALMLMRRPEEAMSEFSTGDRRAGGQPWIGEQAWVAAAGGSRHDAIQWARSAEQDNPNAFLLSVIWAELGEKDRAMDWVQKAYDSRAPGLISLKVNPIFDGLRSSARFQAILRKMNLL